MFLFKTFNLKRWKRGKWKQNEQCKRIGVVNFRNGIEITTADCCMWSARLKPPIVNVCFPILALDRFHIVIKVYEIVRKREYWITITSRSRLWNLQYAKVIWCFVGIVERNLTLRLHDFYLWLRHCARITRVKVYVTYMYGFQLRFHLWVFFFFVH